MSIGKMSVLQDEMYVFSQLGWSVLSCEKRKFEIIAEGAALKNKIRSWRLAELWVDVTFELGKRLCR